MLYRPFADNLSDVSPEDLERLREVHEGWYVEYKQQLIGNRELAKSLSSFANQYGGWLFLGVSEDGQNHVANEFPGIPDSEVQFALESIRNAAKDLLNPPVFYNVRLFPGPIASIGIEEGHSIIVVQVPEGPNPPYIHNDGRIYRRVGDSSQPVPVADRSTFDLLAQRGEETRKRLAERVLWSPVTSKGEENQPYIHVSILSDPYEVMGHWYGEGFEAFAETMKGFTLPFDNVFSMPGGFIARQVGRNDPYKRVLTWHFSRNCHSFVTIPIPTLQADVTQPVWAEYSTGSRFVSMLANTELTYCRVLDLNGVLNLLGAIMRRHCILSSQAKVNGPFYLKAHLEAVWRTIPFVDHSAYLEHIGQFGYPVVQETEITVPDGTTLDTFVVAPEIALPPQEGDLMSGEGFVALFMRILDALGIPMVVLARSIEELHSAGRRSQEIQGKLTAG